MAGERTHVMGGYREAYRSLAVAQKSSKGAPAYSRFVNRPLGRRFAAAAYSGGLTPNAVTGISALFSFTGLILLALVPPSWWLGVVVSALLVIGYALDSADGQVARLRGGGSPQGEWLDHTVDAAKISVLHLAVFVAAYRFFDLDHQWLLIPLGFLVVANVMFFGMILRDLIAARQTARTGIAATPPDQVSSLRSLMVLPTDYGVLCLIFVLLGAPTVFFVAYSALLVGNAAFLLLALPKWYRDVSRLT